MKVSIVYASMSLLYSREINVPPHTQLRHAIEQTDLLKVLPEINLSVNKVGVFGRLVSLNYVLEEGDRIEIYRPLKIDPKAARRLRAERSA